MKSEIEGRYYIECSCRNPEHLLVFDFWDGTLGIYFSSNWHETLWTRIKLAFKFIFKRDAFFTSNSVLIKDDNVKQLEEVIDRIKRSKNEKM